MTTLAEDELFFSELAELNKGLHRTQKMDQREEWQERELEDEGREWRRRTIARAVAVV